MSRFVIYNNVYFLKALLILIQNSKNYIKLLNETHIRKSLHLFIFVLRQKENSLKLSKFNSILRSLSIRRNARLTNRIASN